MIFLTSYLAKRRLKTKTWRVASDQALVNGAASVSAFGFDPSRGVVA